MTDKYFEDMNLNDFQRHTLEARIDHAMSTAIAAAVLAETTRCAKVASAAIGHIVLTTMTLAEMNELCADKAYRAIMGEVTK